MCPQNVHFNPVSPKTSSMSQKLNCWRPSGQYGAEVAPFPPSSSHARFPCSCHLERGPKSQPRWKAPPTVLSVLTYHAPSPRRGPRSHSTYYIYLLLHSMFIGQSALHVPFPRRRPRSPSTHYIQVEGPIMGHPLL